MRLIAKILSFFVLLMLVALSFAATIPLRFIVEHLPDMPLPVQISHVQGTVPNGNIILLLPDLPIPPEINSKIKTFAVAWQWCPSFDIGLSAMCVEADTELAQGVFKTVISPVATELYDVSISSELKRLPVLIANNTMDVSGNIQLSLSSIVIPFAASFPSRVQGEVLLQDLIVGLFKLGDFRFTLSSKENEELNADIKGSGELFSAQGVAGLNKSGEYQYNIDVESGHTLVRNFLSKQGQANAEGGYRLAKTGVLPKT